MTTMPSQDKLDAIMDEHRGGATWRELARKHQMSEATLKGYYFPEQTLVETDPPLLKGDRLLARLKRGLR